MFAVRILIFQVEQFAHHYNPVRTSKVPFLVTTIVALPPPLMLSVAVNTAADFVVVAINNVIVILSNRLFHQHLKTNPVCCCCCRIVPLKLLHGVTINREFLFACRRTHLHTRKNFKKLF